MGLYGSLGSGFGKNFLWYTGEGVCSGLVATFSTGLITSMTGLGSFGGGGGGVGVLGGGGGGVAILGGGEDSRGGEGVRDLEELF